MDKLLNHRKVAPQAVFRDAIDSAKDVGLLAAINVVLCVGIFCTVFETIDDASLFTERCIECRYGKHQEEVCVRVQRNNVQEKTSVCRVKRVEAEDKATKSGTEESAKCITDVRS